MVFAWMVNGLALLLVVGAGVSMIRQRRRRQRARRSARDLVISPMSGIVLGAMLLGFQQFYQPQVRNFIAEEAKQDIQDDDGSGDPPPGGWLLHHQLRQIRLGAEVDTLTVQVEPGGAASPPAAP